ncbi:MAG: ABC transporter substrate-binding protein [Betaproteobacteria bacterium]
MTRHPFAPDAPRAAPPRLGTGVRRRFAALLAIGLALLAPTADAADVLRIATSRSPVSLPIYVAQRQGFFADEQLEVTLTDCIGGTRCLRRLLDGQADLATTSEMPVVLQSFAHPDVAIIATMVNATDNLKLIARKASGISGSEQLAGRHVGVIAGTTAQYLLETHLLAIGVDPRHVTMVPLQPEDTVAALRAGRIDAVAVWEPFGYAALHGADPAGVRLPLRGGYIESFNLVALRASLGKRDAVLTRLLRAVERAEQFIHAHPAEAQGVLREQLQLDQNFVDWVWDGLGFRLSLDQSLLSTMAGQVRWAQREGHVPAGARPNVLTLIYPGPLKAVNPTAVGTGN